MNPATGLSVRFTVAALIATQGVPAFAATNVPPAVVVSNAAQRIGTTYMDIDYRVNDPDDAALQIGVLGFVNGSNDLSSVVRVTTLVEGTATNIGTNTPANTPLHLVWNAAADWSTNFGNVQIEILAKDNRSLLPYHWITLPSNGPNPEITINEGPILDSSLLPLWFWLLANHDPAVQLVNGQVLGLSGSFASNVLAYGTSTTPAGRDFLWQRLNLRSLAGGELTRARAGRYGLQSAVTNTSTGNYFVAKGYVASDRIRGWGNNQDHQLDLPLLLPSITSIALGGQHTLMLSGGGILGWGDNSYGQITIPAGATNVVAIVAGYRHSLALRVNGTIVGWGDNSYGQITIPASAANVVAIAAGGHHSLALRANGTVVAWGRNDRGQTDVPASATNVVAISAGGSFCLALRADGTVINWGYDNYGLSTIPASATNVVAISAGGGHSLALRTDGRVIGWGWNPYGQATIPPSATNAVAISAGDEQSLVLRANGTVVVWGGNQSGETNVPAFVQGIDLIGVGSQARHIVVVDKQTP